MTFGAVGFDNVEVIHASLPGPTAGGTEFYIVTGVALIPFFSGNPANQGDWTRDFLSFAIPQADGSPLVVQGIVGASAIAFPATYQNIGGGPRQDGWGIDNTSTASSPPGSSGPQNVILTARIVVRDTQGTIVRVGFQANILAVAPIQ